MRRFFFLLMLLLLSSYVTVAQDSQNLLTNPGFEDPFRMVSDGREVAEGWQPWNLEPGPNSPSYENAQPIYEPVAPDTTRIRSGSNAQQYYTDLYFTHVGGVYQRVTGITPSTELRFSVYAYVWSSSLDDPDVSEDPGGVLVEVGIDPTGGTDPTSSNIEWGVSAEQYDAYRQYSVIATATSNAVTVFIRSSVDFPQRNNYVYLDDAVLEVTTGSPVQPGMTDTPQPLPTNTAEPLPTNTPEPLPTDTAEPLPTNTPEPPPSEEPQDPTPTREGGGIVVSPTNTLAVPILPTNTSPPQIPTDTPPAATATTVSTSAPVGGPATATPTLAFGNTVTHTVRRGDTVGRLAELYGSTTQAIIQANNLGPDALIFVGQGLIIPVPVAAPATNTPSPTPLVIATSISGGTGGPIQDTAYIVQPGDTLLRIASRFNTTVSAIAQANGIVNVNLIRSGQRLIIPGVGGPVGQVVPTSVPAQSVPILPSGGQTTTYVVQPGDNLYRISLRFGVPMADIVRANGILNVNRLFAGQELIIP